MPASDGGSSRIDHGSRCRLLTATAAAGFGNQPVSTDDSPQDLYGLPLDRFVPERTALVKALRGEKRRDEASEVAALKKPTVAAWAVNQLVRTQAKGVRALLAAGDDLAQAQGRAAAGKGGGDAMRAATRRLRDATDVLLQAAEGLLSSDGHTLSSPTMDRISETLRAAAVDEHARHQVAGGCLTHELQFAGVGVGLGVEVDAETETEAKTGTKAATDTKADREAARQRAAALKDARRTEADARRAVTRADKELAAARARRDEAAASLDQASTLLATAEDQAKDAAVKLTEAERARTDLEG